MTREQEEAFEAICTHYGLQTLIQQIDDILQNIQKGCMSVPLDNDPKTASMQLFRERMKYEGATALKQALMVRINNARDRIQQESAR